MSAPRRLLTSADAVGGVWRFVVDLGRELGRRGVRTTVAVMGPAPSDSQRAEALEAGLEVEARPYRLEWMDEPWEDVGRAGDWLLELARDRRPDVVHLNGYAHASLNWACPVMVVAHSCVRSWWRAVRHEPPPAAVDAYSAAVRNGLAAAHMVVAPSAAMAATLAAEYGIATQARVIPNGYGDGAPAADAKGKEDCILAAGRLWDGAKNIAALAAAASFIEWPVYVAGEACPPSHAGRSCAALRTLGRLPFSELAKWYRRASIYALPARYEPFGLSILEAAASGCALVLGDIPSLRENWDGAAAFVDPDDRAGLVATLQQLIDRPGERGALGRRARERAATFTIERTADLYLDAYRALTA